MTCWIDEVLDGAGIKSHAFMLGTFFYTYIGTLYADFQEKIFPETSWKKLQTFHCSNVTAMKSLELFPRRFRKDFFLKIDLCSAKVYKKRPQHKMWLHPYPAQNSVYQVSHCNALLIDRVCKVLHHSVYGFLGIRIRISWPKIDQNTIINDIFNGTLHILGTQPSYFLQNL